MLNQVKNQLQELSWLLRGLKRGEYPDFVVQGVSPTTIPVFCYHRILAFEFEQHLLYLRRNAYRTLTTDAYLASITQNDVSLPRAVVLTFDDGIEDLHRVAFPLLKKYQCTAVAFIMANWVGRPGMISWQQAKEMHETGVIDFQSHTLNHAGIFIGPNVIDFYRPGYLAHQNWNLPVIGNQPLASNQALPAGGTPIYEFVSRLADQPRFFPAERVIELCQKYVQEKGGDNFFNTRHWFKELKAFHQSIFEQYASETKFESTQEQKKVIWDELTGGKAGIEAQLSGKTVRHISFPWNQSGRLTRSLLQEAGYFSAYGGLSKVYVENGQTVDRYYINRVSGDFVRALPGKGRLSMPAIMLSKIRRRLLKGAMY